MWWSTLIFGGMELHGKRRSLFLTLIIILYSSTLHNGRVRSQDPVVIQRNYHWLHFLNWIMAYAFWTVFGNLFKACLGTVRYLCLRGGRWFSRNSGIWKIYPSPEVGNLKNYPPVYVTGPKCNPPTPTPSPQDATCLRLRNCVQHVFWPVADKPKSIARSFVIVQYGSSK